jgi:hypothetical protein
LIPPDLDFLGQPQLIATRRGRGSGHSLGFNGHIDAVSAEPGEARSSGRSWPRSATVSSTAAARATWRAASRRWSPPLRLAGLGIELDGDHWSRPTPTKSRPGRGGTALVDRGRDGRRRCCGRGGWSGVRSAPRADSVLCLRGGSADKIAGDHDPLYLGGAVDDLKHLREGDKASERVVV